MKVFWKFDKWYHSAAISYFANKYLWIYKIAFILHYFHISWFWVGTARSWAPNLRGILSLNLIMSLERGSNSSIMTTLDSFKLITLTTCIVLALLNLCCQPMDGELQQFGICFIKAILGNHRPASLNSNYIKCIGNFTKTLNIHKTENMSPKIVIL